MPRYHFNIHDGRYTADTDGHILPDLRAARAEALKLAGQIIRDAGIRADLGEDWSVEVTDEAGLLLFRMEFFVAESHIAARTRLKVDNDN